MVKVSISLWALLISTFSFSQIQQGKFEITGNVSGFEDSTFIIMYDFSTGENVFMDSTRIIHGRFVFKGDIKKDYQSVGLMCQRDLKIFWIESGIIHFNAVKENFDRAVITGSAMQDENNLLDSIVRANPNNQKESYIAYIKNHPNSLISGSVLRIFCTTWGKDTSRFLYEGLSERVKQSEFGKIVYNYISLNKDPQVGDHFADFTMPDMNGKNISLSDYKNKYVLLDFWGSWCQPCRKENPELVKTYNEFKEKGFDVLGVSCETARHWWVEAVQQDHIPWENVSDLTGRDNQAALIYGIHYYPANFLIAPDGIIIGKDLKGDVLREKLSEILK
jgi:peroxiredoxin